MGASGFLIVWFRSRASPSASMWPTSPRPSAPVAWCKADRRSPASSASTGSTTPRGLPQKFKAFGRFLEKCPLYQRQVVLTQIAPPTRASVEAYADIRQQLEALAGSINGRFGELDWVPIHYIHRSTPRRRLADIYRSSRIGMVTPLRDGMNLVAKEYVAAQDPEDPGVLVLSQFAGAAEELTEALIVNPYNIEETADIIRAALEMPLTERRTRHEALLAAVRKHDVASWSQSFLSQLDRVASVQDPVSWRAPEPIRTALAKLEQVMDPQPRPAARKPRECRGLRAEGPQRDRTRDASSVPSSVK